MTNLETSDLVIYFAIISKTLETIPVHWISRFILRDKKMLKNEIVKLDLDNQLQKILKSERRSDKRKEEGNSKKSNSKSVYFDNGVGLSQESFKLCLETCIQLMSDVQINSSPTIWQLNWIIFCQNLNIYLYLTNWMCFFFNSGNFHNVKTLKGKYQWERCSFLFLNAILECFI